MPMQHTTVKLALLLTLNIGLSSGFLQTLGIGLVLVGGGVQYGSADEVIWGKEPTAEGGVLEEDRSKEWVETCDTHITQIKVSFPGCVSKSLITYACKGTCYSRSVPKWKPELENTHMVHHCMCCKPMVKRFRMVTLDCPSRGKPKNRLVSAAMDCRCRPCSDGGQPEPDQPYDY